MVELVVSRDPDFELSRADIDRPPPHYALGTMKWLAERYPHDGFVYLMGSDSLRDLPSWHKASEFLKRCNSLGVFHRHGAEVDLDELEKDLPGIRSKVRYFSGPTLDITGREIRKRVRTGERYGHLLPYGLKEIIADKDLYH
jgi:nicotinate-nucleotide adenylyltransferase